MSSPNYGLRGIRPRPDRPPGPPRSPARRRLLWALAGLVVALAAAGTVWAATQPGRYGRSANGCVNVMVPSSTGGAIVHGCGATARSMCRAAFAGHDKLARLTRPQCLLAGLGPTAPATAPASP